MGTTLFVGKVITAVGAGALTVGLALSSAGVWKASDEAVLLLSLIAAVVAFLSSAGAAWADYRGRRKKQLEAHVTTHVRAAFWNVYDVSKGQISPKDLGIAVYLLAWDHPRLRSCRPYWRPRRLQRLHRERPRHHNESTGLIWRPGKGVIGACVAQSGISYTDVGGDWQPHVGATRSEWDALEHKLTQGLSYAEFRSLVDGGKRLGVVIASPILKDGRAVGCVSVDGPTGPVAYELLCGQQVKDHLADTAIAIGMLL